MDPTHPCLVAVMGCTGAGKSSFIRLVTGSDVQVGHSLHSMTSEVASYHFNHRGKTITLVDTPGFDDSSGSDRDILLKLLTWLKSAHDANQKLSGIIYLHRIDTPRMQGSALRNFGLVKKLCGEQFYKNVIFGTTCWDLVDAETIGVQRESQLKDEGGFWHPLILKGSQVERIPRERDAARDLVHKLALRDPAFLASQADMGAGVLTLDQASVTSMLDPALSAVQEENKQALERAQADYEAQLRDREQKAKEERERERRRQEEILRQQEAERERLARMYREREEQRAREMRDMQEAMRRARIREAEERERERRRQEEICRQQQEIRDRETAIREARIREAEEREKERRQEEIRRQQQAEKERLARLQREREKQQAREMRERQEAIQRQARIRAAEEREAEEREEERRRRQQIRRRQQAKRAREQAALEEAARQYRYEPEPLCSLM